MIRSETHDAVTTITLDRPEKLNAFVGRMREDLLAALRAAEGDANCRVVVITGAGRAFCAGGDVDYMSGLQRTTPARAIAEGPPLAIADIKRALTVSRTNTLRAQVDLESEHQLRAFLSSDAGEGMAAFFEKRAPKFEGS